MQEAISNPSAFLLIVTGFDGLRVLLSLRLTSPMFLLAALAAFAAPPAAPEAPCEKKFPPSALALPPDHLAEAPASAAVPAAPAPGLKFSRGSL